MGEHPHCVNGCGPLQPAGEDDPIEDGGAYCPDCGYIMEGDK